MPLALIRCPPFASQTIMLPESDFMNPQYYFKRDKKIYDVIYSCQSGMWQEYCRNWALGMQYPSSFRPGSPWYSQSRSQKVATDGVFNFGGIFWVREIGGEGVCGTYPKRP